MYQVYIDATIPSNLVAKQSRDPKIARWQNITREFWSDTRFQFIVSDAVIAEISVGDNLQVIDRLKAVEGLPNLIVEDSDIAFAQQLVDGKAIPQAAFTDAVHVAVAARHLIPYLATWNFAHLANPRTLPKIEQICQNVGHRPPRIDSPEGILEELSCAIIP
jgi:hypothetical protein